MGAYIVGLDLGQAHDPSALVVLDRTLEGTTARYNAPHIERFPLGTTYPAIVEAVDKRMHSPALRGATLIIDGTGVGRPVVDMFRPRGCYLVPVLITAGNQESQDEYGYWHVPKRDLVGAVQVLLQSGRLKIAARLPEAQTLAQELLSFEAKITASANDVYGAWREGKHDDLVLGLALASWWGESHCSDGVYL